MRRFTSRRETGDPCRRVMLLVESIAWAAMGDAPPRGSDAHPLSTAHRLSDRMSTDGCAMVDISIRCGSAQDQLFQEGLLGVHAVLGFVPYCTLWPIQHLRGDLLSAMG